MNLQALKKRLAELQAQGQTIIKAVEAAGDEWAADQETEFDGIETEIATVKEQIAAAEKTAERKRRMASLGAGTALTPAGATTVHDLNPETTGGFKSLGEFAAAVHGTVLGGQSDERLVAVANTHQGGGSAGEGFSLPPQYRDEIWELVTEFDDFGPLIDEEPTSARQVKGMADETTPWGSSGIQAYWRAEGAQMDPTKQAKQERTTHLHDMYTLALATDELLEDAPRLEARLGRKAAQAIAWKKNLAIVEGNGVGQPLGWMKSDALVSVAKESGQAADTINAANVVKMYSRLLMVPGGRPFWMANSDTLPQLMTMTIGDKPVWMPGTGLADAPNGTLMGLPLRLMEYAKTLGDKGDLQLIQPQGYYGARRVSGVSYATSIHLYFDYGIQAFRWMFRYGGQPHLSAPVSPNNGAATKSHFVVLDERAA